jgi:hypothetical protein
MKNVVFYDMSLMAFVRTDVSERLITSNIRLTRVGELGTTLAVAINRSTLGRITPQSVDCYKIHTVSHPIAFFKCRNPYCPKIIL